MLPQPRHLPARPVLPQHQDRGNSPPEGGFGKFRRLGLERSTVATWLDDAGYDTFYAGKYMNGYDDTTHVPDGWDKWYGWLGQYYSPGGEYRLNENGDIKRYSLDKVHDTDLLKDKAIDFIRDQRGDGKPFFAYLAPNAPHTPAYVPARHEGMFSDRSLPRSPSFNEEDMSDKPEIVRNLPMDHDEVKSLGNSQEAPRLPAVGGRHDRGPHRRAAAHQPAR